MIRNIQNEFKTMLNEYDWMDGLSRRAAIEKVKISNLEMKTLNKP